MNSIDYKQKYLKYKNKYLELKDIEKQKVLSGGFMYASGEYVFFIPESKKMFVDNVLLVKNNNIVSLDKLTTELGNCTRFLRIGSNVNNKTIYTNQSSMDVMKRETKNIEEKSIEAYKAAKEETQKAYEVAKKETQKAYEAAKPLINTASNAAIKGATFVANATTAVAKVVADATKKTPETPGTGTTGGGADDCDKSPITLPATIKEFSFDDEVTEETLPDYISLINEKQGSEKIARVIVVQKKTNSLGLGGETKLKYDFVISYNDGKVKVVKK
jgi:gamma-glutamylcyclotransferase (GGCT)/AIG2-like uncharacterized protein YtfP